MFSKIDVNGDTASPVYRFLKSAAPDEEGNEDIPWNFTKFLIDRDGNVVKRFAPQDAPSAIAKHIEKLL